LRPNPVQNFLVGPSFHAVIGRCSTYSVAVDLEPRPASPQHTSSRLDVLLAASLPGDAESVVAPPELAERAHALGFALSSCAAGLVASGSVALQRAKKREPAAVADGVAGAAALLVEWATRVGATAATPIA
jgi:hypothetical protein